MTKPSFWQVQFDGVFVGGFSLGPARIFNTPGIVDSGTPFLTLPTSSLALFKAHLLANCSQNPLVGVCNVPSNATVFEGACVSMTKNQISAWPTISIQLAGGVVLNVTKREGFVCCPNEVSFR